MIVIVLISVIPEKCKISEVGFGYTSLLDVVKAVLAKVALPQLEVFPVSAKLAKVPLAVAFSSINEVKPVLVPYGIP